MNSYRVFQRIRGGVFQRICTRIPRLVQILAIVGLIGLALTGLSGCGGGLPDAIKDKARAVAENIEKTDKHIRDQRDKFNSLASSGGFAPMAGYAEKENWAQAFDQAGSILSRGQEIYDTELVPLLKENNPDKAVAVAKKISRITKVVQEARQKAQAPFDRMDRIRTAMEDTREIHTRAGAAAKTILTGIRTLEAGPVAEALEKFPDSASKINARVAPLAKLSRNTTANLAVVEQEYTAHKNSGQANYAAFITAADTIARNRKAFSADGPALEKDLDLLYQSYTKVLQDMKVDHYVIVKRESWDDRIDYYDPGIVSFERFVTPATYREITGINLESIADLTPGYGGVSFKNNIGNLWQALSINPTENWPSRNHNAATFWIEDTREAYFHKYLMENNGETEETDWIKVNPSFFDQNINNLGMAILSKPYGVFEPDPQAAPPGMAYVGNPEYGEWKKDENGDSFWAWYGRYAFFSSLFFFPPSYYYYGSWNRWNTGYRYKKPYYGKTKTGAYTYGTRGTKIKRSPQYQNSTFARTGGLKSVPASVRGGGSSLRGGGPKGKGK
ncbi:MAG: hypothetical protein MI863_29775 [Desulfobacterales bacterium]|nr:hypothetical protein [Desulfobacterales bacterium]